VSAGPIVVLYAAPVWRGEDALEMLRVAAALVACGHPLRLAETSPVLSGDDLPDEAERILDQLAEFGVVPEPFTPETLAAARSVLRLGAADRSGRPPLASGPDPDPRVVHEAGQFTR